MKCAKAKKRYKYRNRFQTPFKKYVRYCGTTWYMMKVLKCVKFDNYHKINNLRGVEQSPPGSLVVQDDALVLHEDTLNIWPRIRMITSGVFVISHFLTMLWQQNLYPKKNSSFLQRKAFDLTKILCYICYYALLITHLCTYIASFA